MDTVELLYNTKQSVSQNSIPKIMIFSDIFSGFKHQQGHETTGKKSNKSRYISSTIL